MRALFLTTLLIAVPAFAKSHVPAKIPAPSDIKISTTFEYSDALHTAQTDGSAIFDRANHDWKTIADNAGIVLQARIISSSPKDVRLEYQVLDAKNNNAVLASPAFIALFGEKAVIEGSQENGGKLKLAILANPVK